MNDNKKAIPRIEQRAARNQKLIPSIDSCDPHYLYSLPSSSIIPWTLGKPLVQEEIGARRCKQSLVNVRLCAKAECRTMGSKKFSNRILFLTGISGDLLQSLAISCDLRNVGFTVPFTFSVVFLDFYIDFALGSFISLHCGFLEH